MKSLLQNRTFWVAILTLFVLIVGVSIPGFSLDVEHAAGLGVIVAVYLVTASTSSGDNLKSIFLSRKFWASGIGFVVVFLDAFKIFPAPLDVGSLAGLVVILSAYTIALAYDPGKGWRGLLVSRKFWTALVGVVVIFLNAFKVALPVGLTSEQIVGIAVVFGGSIAAFGAQQPPLTLPAPEIPDESE